MRNSLFVAVSATLLCTTAAAPASAASLEFAGFTASSVQGNSPEIKCTTIQMPYYCDWDRKSLGGMLLISPKVSFNKITGKIESISFNAMKWAEDNAIETFSTKYGKPSSDMVEKKINKFGGPYEQRIVQWDFDGRDYVSIYRNEDELFVSVVWRQNLPSIDKPKVDF